MTENNVEDRNPDNSVIVGETKEQRFTRVVNHRLAVAVERLRLMEQMFSSSGVNAYEFTPEQVDRLEAYLGTEVDKIIDSARKVLARRGGSAVANDVPQL